MTSPQPLKTARLRLTRPDPSDVDAVFQIHSDVRTYPHRPDLVMRSREEAEELVRDWIGDWERDGIGYYVVRTHDDSPIGFTGVRRKRLDDQEVLNLYYRFAPQSQGRGYAKEAASAAIAAAVENAPNIPVVAAIDPTNAPSAHLAIALGLTRERTDIASGHDIYRL